MLWSRLRLLMDENQAVASSSEHSGQASGMGTKRAGRVAARESLVLPLAGRTDALFLSQRNSAREGSARGVNRRVLYCVRLLVLRIIPVLETRGTQAR